MLVKLAHLIVDSLVRLPDSDAFLCHDNFSRIWLVQDGQAQLWDRVHDAKFLAGWQDTVAVATGSSIAVYRGDSLASPKKASALILHNPSNQSLGKVSHLDCVDDQVYCVDNAGLLTTWSCTSGKVSDSFLLDPLGVTASAYSPEQHLFLFANTEGQLNFTDLRSHQLVRTLEPHKDQKLLCNDDNGHGHLDNWISTIDIDRSSPDWLVFGGSTKLCLFNHRTMHYTNVLEPNSDNTWYPQKAKFINYCGSSLIAAGGNSNRLFCWNPQGCLKFEFTLPSSGASAICHINDFIPSSDGQTICAVGASAALHKIKTHGCVMEQILFK